jgi:hypothetical protein
MKELSDLPDLEKKLERLEKEGKFDELIRLAKKNKLSTSLHNYKDNFCDSCGDQTKRVLQVLYRLDMAHYEHDSYSTFKDLPITTAYLLNVRADLSKIDSFIRSRLAKRINSLEGFRLKNELEIVKTLLARDQFYSVCKKDGGGYGTSVAYDGDNVVNNFRIRLCDKHNTSGYLMSAVDKNIKYFADRFLGYIPKELITVSMAKGARTRKHQ